MAQLSSLMDGFTPSAISRIFSLANRLKAEGRDIVDLSVGEPDFPTPDNVKQAGIEAISNNITKYTDVSGTAALRAAVARKFKRDNGLDFTADQIVIDAGVKPLLYHGLQAMLEPGSEVVLPTPCWASYGGMIKLAGGIAVPVRCPQSKGFKLQADDLEAAITPQTSVVMLNSPSNPTGAAYNWDEMKALTDVLLRHPHVWVLADDIYEHITYGNFAFVTPAQVEPRLAERTLTLNGVSKAYSMTGWRIGYGGGPSELMSAIVKILSQNNGSPPSMSQAAAIEALDGPQEVLAERAAEFQLRRDYVLGRMKDMCGLKCHAPEGAFYLFPDCSGLMGLRTADGMEITSSTDLARYFLEAYDLAVVPGAAFDFDPNIRISYATSMENLVKACDRMTAACAALK